MPNNNKDKDIDLDRGYDTDYPKYSRDSRDDLDNYNDNLSKRAVGSIFNNIESSNSKSKQLEHDDDLADDFTIDTNFSIQSNKQRKQLVSDVFADDTVAPKRKPKNAKPTRLGDTSPNPINSKKQLSSANSAFTSDDDTLFNKKYVTRGNHMAVTPAMAAKRKNKTMMESQRIPTVTDEEILAYKSSITLAESQVSSPLNPRNSTDKNFDDDYDRSITKEQKEIYDYLQSEIQRKELSIENTMHRINEKTKHYNEIIESTNKKYNSALHSNLDRNQDDDLRLSDRTTTPVTTSPSYTAFSEESINNSSRYTPVDETNIIRHNPSTEVNINGNNFSKNYFNQDDLTDLDALDNFDDLDALNGLDDTSQLSISTDDLDKDFEDTIATNSTFQEKTSRQSRPLIPSNNLSESKPKVRRGNDSLIKKQSTGNVYDLDAERYNTKKTKFNTGEVTLINDTVATEISLEDLDDLVFDNYDTTDMAFLRQAIKEKSQARKMQVLEEQFSEFEKNHRDFGNKNVPPKTAPRPRPHRKQEEPSVRESYIKESPVRDSSRDTSHKDTARHDDFDNYDTNDTGRVTTRSTRHEPDYNSYEYRKAQTSQHNGDYNTGRHNTTESGRHNTVNTNTGRYNTSHTGRIPPTHTSKITTVDLDNDYDDYEDFSKKFNVSLVFNIIFLVTLSCIAIFSYLKTSELSSQIEELSAANAELVEVNNKVNELQIDVDYYKNLYQNTAEGKAALEAEKKAEQQSAEQGNTPNAETSSESSETPAASGTTYTVQSGDTLSSISKKVYGTSSEYQKIKDANKLTSDNVSIGQVLIIP